MGKVISTLVLVVVAVAASGALWVGANVLFNQVRSSWQRFLGIAHGIVGGVVAVVLHGNGVLRFSNDGFLAWIWPPIAIAVLAAALGAALARTDDTTQRLAVGAGGYTVLGVVLGALVEPDLHPGLDPVALLVWTVVLAAIGAGIAALRKQPVVNGALLLGAIGWIAGGWGAAELGAGSTVEAIVAMVAPFAVIGYLVSSRKNPELVDRAIIDTKSRSWIFLTPALAFILVTLVIPAIRTAYLSLLDDSSEEFVGFGNYGSTFTDTTSFDASEWTDVFGSRLLWIGIAALVVTAVLAVREKRQTGRAVELGAAPSFPLMGGVVLVLFALFTAFRGTLINNLWWVLVVTLFSTGIGLAVAVLADNAGGERVAKSIIFMPMAISMVGASIIWRFMYIPRDTSTAQTGVLNALWVGLGQLSTGSGLPTLLVGIAAILVLLGLLVAVARALTTQNHGRASVIGIVAVLVGWFVIRYWGIVGAGVGGFRVSDDGAVEAEIIGFIQESPFNSFWLMIILVWIQTGFAMVILSAAIKSVPTEFVEAARVDGATPSQIFWRIVLPQIATTIGVVVTTIIVLVMKVFDIVKVVTNGNFGTQVLANDMFQQAFQFGNTGRGAALAMLILLSVLPVMYYNIRRMQREQ
ncbi:MAG: sugar ABC transporter permease [Ilumatobacteraceae bacterium]